MRADPFTLTSIFGGDVRYVVPMFQRPYVWNIKEHWEPLWEDIRGVTERVQAATEPRLFAADRLAAVFSLTVSARRH